ncbi:hypothetical protein MTO96_039186 [Rhipicephalus appendiculatus]
MFRLLRTEPRVSLACRRRPCAGSASIDSLLDATAAAAAAAAHHHQTSCLAANGQADEASFQTTPTSGLMSRPGALPNSPSVPSRLAKGVPGLRQSSVELLLDGFSLSKSERKKLEKLNKFNIDLQGDPLFAAVEHHHIERARSILETSDVDVNSVNTDGFTALDVAVLTGEASLARLLQSRGASESPPVPDVRGQGHPTFGAASRGAPMRRRPGGLRRLRVRQPGQPVQRSAQGEGAPAKPMEKAPGADLRNEGRFRRTP